MSHHNPPQIDDPYLQAYLKKVAKRDHRTEHIFRRVLHILERVIASITLLALLGALGIELYHMFTTGSEYFADAALLVSPIRISSAPSEASSVTIAVYPRITPSFSIRKLRTVV